MELHPPALVWQQTVQRLCYLLPTRQPRARCGEDQTTTSMPEGFSPSPEQIIRWLDYPEVRQAIFAIIAQEALANRSPLGRAIGLRSGQR